MAINLPIVSKFVDKGVNDATSALGGLGSSFKKLAGIAVTALGSIGFGNFVKDSVTAASDLNESLNAVNVAYGDAAEAVLKLGENSAKSMGVAQTEFNAAAVRFSAFAERVVGEGGNVGDFIGDITTRAADFASVFNIEVSEALQVFQSGLSGEAEPLKRFGINLLQSEVQAYALRTGLIEVGETMTEQQKVQARYGLLMESTAKTAGDFANTSDGLANSQRILSASFTNIQATIGTALLPVFSELVQSILPLVEEVAPELTKLFEDLAPVITDLAGLIPDLVRAVIPIVPLFSNIIEVLAEVAVQLFPILVKVIEALLPIITTAVEIFGQLLLDVIEPLAPALLELIDGFLPLVEAILPLLVELTEALLPVITELLLDVILPLAPAFVSLIQAILPLLTQILPPLVDILQTLFIPALQFAGAVMVSLVDTGINFLKSGLTTLIDFMTPFAKTFTDIWNNISSTVRGVINGILGFIQGFTNGIIDGVNAAIRAINSIKVDIPNWVPIFGGQRFGFNLPQLGRVNIPRLADGGIVMPQPGGVLANLAEAGKPEAVIPLDRLGSMGDKNVTYNITVNAGMGADGQDLGRVIVDQILRYERSSGRVFARA